MSSRLLAAFVIGLLIACGIAWAVGSMVAGQERTIDVIVAEWSSR